MVRNNSKWHGQFSNPLAGKKTNQGAGATRLRATPEEKLADALIILDGLDNRLCRRAFPDINNSLKAAELSYLFGHALQDALGIFTPILLDALLKVPPMVKPGIGHNIQSTNIFSVGLCHLAGKAHGVVKFLGIVSDDQVCAFINHVFPPYYPRRILLENQPANIASITDNNPYKNE